VIGRFVATIVGSIYSPPFYLSIPRRSSGAAATYFLVLALFLAVARVTTALPAILTLHDQAPRWLDAAVDYYPDGLEIRISGGQVSTNMPEPYRVPLPANARPPTNLLVIDTKTPFSIDQFTRYDTLIWLTHDALHARDENGIRTQDLSQVGDVTIDKGIARAFGEVVRPWLGLIAPALLPFALIGMYLLNLSRLLYLLLFAFVIWLVLRIFNRPAGYGLAYKTGLYAMTLPLIVETIVALAGVRVAIPFMFSFEIVAVLALNYLAARELEAAV
jgi:hypothetical protein